MDVSPCFPLSYHIQHIQIRVIVFSPIYYKKRANQLGKIKHNQFYLNCRFSEQLIKLEVESCLLSKSKIQEYTSLIESHSDVNQPTQITVAFEIKHVGNWNVHLQSQSRQVMISLYGKGLHTLLLMNVVPNLGAAGDANRRMLESGQPGRD